MNADQKHKPAKRFRWFRLLIVVGFVIVALGLLFPPVYVHRTPKRIAARSDALMICSALKTYYIELGTAPSGDSAEMMAMLRGKNSRKIIFFEADPKRFNRRGEFLDLWGTPYRMGVLNLVNPWAYSFGPNAIDEGGVESSDDISSWR